MLTLNTGGRAAKKDLAQLWVTCHEATNESRDFTTASEARQLQPLGDDPGQFLCHIHSFGGRPVLYDVGIAVGKDHEVTSIESYALPIQQPGRGVPLSEQVVDDYEKLRVRRGQPQSAKGSS